MTLDAPVRALIEAARDLCRDLAPLEFGLPVTHVYNPLEYARPLHEAYLARFGQGSPEVVLLGMNPGPFGMAQTGVPFGDPESVRGFLGLDGNISSPASPHPRRPVLGLDSTRGEVSGQRLWGAVRERFGTPERFFRRFFVANYCPLCFLEASGRNRTPDKLPAAEREPLFAACDRHLVRLTAALRPRLVVGVGAFAAERARIALGDQGIPVSQILHPSPASPLANRGWADQAAAQLEALGVRFDQNA